MTQPIASSLIHFYDTRTRGILCGVRGADHRSTKHPRGVTCDACVGMREARRALDDDAPPTAPEDAN